MTSSEMAAAVPSGEEPVNNSSPATLPGPVKVLWLEVIVLSLLSLLFFQFEAWKGIPIEHYRALSPPTERFGDFTIFLVKFERLFHTERFFHQYFPFTYPAPVALVYEFFVRVFAKDPITAFVSFSVTAFILPWLFFGAALRRNGVTGVQASLLSVTLLLCSWPAILIVDRGNMEVCVWLALVAAAGAFLRAHLKVAAAFVGLAGALKLFPIVLLGVFLSMRRWRALTVGIFTFVVVSVVSLAALGPSIPLAYQGVADGLTFFKHSYMETWLPWESGVDHSLFALIKLGLITWFDHSETVPFTTALSIYLPATAIAGVALYVFRIRFLPLLNQWLILCIASIYLTAFSGDGTLIHLYYPLLFLALLAIHAHRRGVHIPGLAAALYLLGFLLSYEGFLEHHGVRREGQFKAVALGALLWVALRYRFEPFPWLRGKGDQHTQEETLQA